MHKVWIVEEYDKNERQAAPQQAFGRKDKAFDCGMRALERHGRPGEVVKQEALGDTARFTIDSWSGSVVVTSLLVR